MVKNKVAPPFKVAEFDILYGKGVSFEGSLIDLGLEHKVISKSGAWYSYGEERLGQGRENVREYLIENPDMSKEIENKVRETAGLPLNEITADSGEKELNEKNQGKQK